MIIRVPYAPRIHLLGTESNPHQSCGIAQKRDTRQEPEEKWRREETGTLQHATDDAILEKDLQSLRHLRRPCPALLNLVQIADRQPVFAKVQPANSMRQLLLNRQIDARTAECWHHKLPSPMQTSLGNTIDPANRPER